MKKEEFLKVMKKGWKNDIDNLLRNYMTEQIEEIEIYIEKEIEFEDWKWISEMFTEWMLTKSFRICHSAKRIKKELLTNKRDKIEINYVKRIPGTSTAHYYPPGQNESSSCHSACFHTD